MRISASLGDLIEALQDQSDTLYPFFDRETGEVILMFDESMSLSDAEPEEIELLPDWRKEEAALAKAIASTERYLTLPDRFGVNEWNIMRDFCEPIGPEKTRASLSNAIHGNGSFRRFRNQIALLDLWDPWNQFRRRAFAEVLRPWCEENGVAIRTSIKQTDNTKPERQTSPN